MTIDMTMARPNGKEPTHNTVRMSTSHYGKSDLRQSPFALNHQRSGFPSPIQTTAYHVAATTPDDGGAGFELDFRVHAQMNIGCRV